MEQQETTLGEDDYRALFDLSVASKSGQAQASDLIGKMTPQERREFYGFINRQPHGSERTRTDNSLLGLPPEMAVVSGVGLARSVVGAGTGLAAKAAAGVKNIAEQTTPVLKYELTKNALEHLGVPTPLAMTAAIVVSGYRGNGKNGHAPEIKPGASAPAAPPVEPVASGPVAPAPQAAARFPPAASAPPVVAPPSTAAPGPIPPAPVPAGASEPAIRMGPDGLLVGRPGGNPAMPDQKALNEAALATRRQAAQARTAAAPAEAAAVPAAAGNAKLSAAETKAFMDLMQRGMPSNEALKNVLMQRELVASLGTPTPTAAQTRFPKGMRGKSD